MRKRVSKEPTEQAEDKAISNLLEIDLKSHEQSSNWEQKRSNIMQHDKNRTFSFFRMGQASEQHRTAKNCLKYRNFAYSNERFSPNEMDRSLKEPLTNNKQVSLHDVDSQALCQPNQRDYWSSKVNWMAESYNNSQSNQHRLHKKRPKAFQNHGKAARQRSNRYQNPQRVLTQELKNNLGFSLSKEKMRAQNKQDLNAVRNNKNHNNIAQAHYNLRFNGTIQEYVKETFDKIYEKNHQQYACLPYKQSQQEKSTIVRKLLNNLSGIKDHQGPQRLKNSSVEKNSFRQRNNYPCFNEIVELLDAPHQPQRRLHNKRDQHKILNLNQEAEKVYSSRSINQFSRKNSSYTKSQ